MKNSRLDRNKNHKIKYNNARLGKKINKIQYNKLNLLLKKMGFISHYSDAVKIVCYSKSIFFIKDAFGISDNKK